MSLSHQCISVILALTASYSWGCNGSASFINTGTDQSYPNDLGLIQAGVYQHIQRSSMFWANIIRHHSDVIMCCPNDHYFIVYYLNAAATEPSRVDGSTIFNSVATAFLPAIHYSNPTTQRRTRVRMFQLGLAGLDCVTAPCFSAAETRKRSLEVTPTILAEAAPGCEQLGKRC